MKLFKLPYQTDSSRYFLKLAALPAAVWLDSGKPQSSEGRFDIMSACPSKTCQETDPETLKRTLEQALTVTDEPDALPFSGGWIGFFGYETRHAQFGIEPAPAYECGNSWFGWYDWALIQDHQKACCQVLFTAPCPDEFVQRILTLLRSDTPAPEHSYVCEKFARDEPQARYTQNIETIKNGIFAGDCYQVNYTQRFSAAFKGSALGAFLNLRKATPNPFCAYLALPDGQTVLSLSQERFIRIDDKQALTQPIKGTIGRGRTPAEDRLRGERLVSSSKNRCENVMIVDLLRNDFSYSCEPFSVKTPELFTLRSYTNVHHLVSTVVGTLKDEITHPEFILNCFPGGSITGAPKKRAMQMIDALESFPRGPYCGAIGYFSCNGKSDFNVAIRTLLVERGRIFAWAGGGVVADSLPEDEFEESLVKIGRLLNALSGLQQSD